MNRTNKDFLNECLSYAGTLTLSDLQRAEERVRRINARNKAENTPADETLGLTTIQVDLRHGMTQEQEKILNDYIRGDK